MVKAEIFPNGFSRKRYNALKSENTLTENKYIYPSTAMPVIANNCVKYNVASRQRSRTKKALKFSEVSYLRDRRCLLVGMLKGRKRVYVVLSNG